MSQPGSGSGIDRRALAERHAVEVTQVEEQSPLSVGNGEFCYTVDVTGLQTFPDRYPVGEPPSGTLLATMAQWGWHSVPGGADLDGTTQLYNTPRGKVPYVDLRGELSGPVETLANPAEAWLRGNPHRLDLARIGLVAPGAPVRPADVTEVRQRLDLWAGVVTSRYRLRGRPVTVTTACHPDRDVLAVRIESGLLLDGLAVRLAFPYGSTAWHDAADWSCPDAHRSALHPTARGGLIERVLDATTYTVTVEALPQARLARSGPHEFVVTAGGPVLDLVVGFRPGSSGADADLPTFAAVVAQARDAWAGFWSSGGTVELAGSRDPRAGELERRIVLSQYLTRIHCAGTLPPQETGLLVNSWRGRFHLEMHWWHAGHFALWGRPELLARSMGWYERILPAARDTARRQGYAGARWPKQVAPDGRESPSPIGPFLIWQQPHPIFLAELLRRAAPPGSAEERDVVRRYADLVLASATFMADFAAPGPAGFALGPPLVPAQESYAKLRAVATNPTFELAYWAFGLRVAVQWRERLGLDPEPLWSKVADGMVAPRVRDGVYAALDVVPYTVRDDHPSMLYALGFVPPVGLIDPSVMRATLHRVLGDWPWESTWGWDFPAIAMTAARLGEPAAALDALLMDTPKNRHLPNGHNRQSATLPVYLPGNGGLLAAVALLAAGSDVDVAAGCFPAGDSWTVRHEGLLPSP